MPGEESTARYTFAAPGILIPQRPPSFEAAREMGMPILDDLNGPMRPGAGNGAGDKRVDPHDFGPSRPAGSRLRHGTA